MTNEVTPFDRIRPRAKEALGRLAGLADQADLEAARALVEELRNVRDYETMGQLAEAVSRRDPEDAKNRRLYAQYLIETGKATAAIDLLRPLTRRLPKGHAELAEATGLLGRAYKQIFFDAGDKTNGEARQALKQAILAYRGPFEAEPCNTWHGVNLVALLTRARRLGLRTAPDLQPKDVAARVVATLEQVPMAQRNEWFLPTLAEASLALGDWGAVERHISDYAAVENAQAFLVASTLRQFTQIWDLEHVDDRGRGLVAILRARLAQLPGGSLELKPGELQQLRTAATPSHEQLEAVLGMTGPQTYSWWKTGLNRAAAVASIRMRNGERIGTGFLLHAAEFGREPEGERLVLTNFHVVNEQGANGGIRPNEAEVVFEAVDGSVAYPVDRILWSSPVERHDASLLRLAGAVPGIEPLPVTTALPGLDGRPHVYIIGHPGGRELAFSFQDNELLDHEETAASVLAIPGVCRVHYRAPTEGGSSGSPVFNAGLWQVIALHHKGGRNGMPRLNGKDGTYAANEGISMASILAAHRERSEPRPA